MSEYSCPHCKKIIDDDDALFCLYCGEGLKRSSGFMGAMKYPRTRSIVVALVLLVIFSLFLLLQ